LIALGGGLGYTGQPTTGNRGRARLPGLVGLRTAVNQGFFTPMSSTFDTVANIIAETCDIPRDKIKPESHAIDDLGIDSLDFLDIAFAIDKAFGIKLPLEQWTQEVNDGKATTEQYFVLQNLSNRIDGLVAAKGA
jgi:acyl carrier protein